MTPQSPASPKESPPGEKDFHSEYLCTCKHCQTTFVNILANFHPVIGLQASVNSSASFHPVIGLQAVRPACTAFMGFLLTAFILLGYST